MHAIVGFVATSSRKVKIDAVESQITLLFWPWLLATEKQRTVWALYNQNKTSSHTNISMIQSLSFTGVSNSYMKEL